MAEKRKDHKGRLLKAGESQRSDQTYMYRYNDSRGKRLYVYAKTLDELRQKEQDIDKALALGIHRPPTKTSVFDLVKTSVDKRRLRDSTRCVYSSNLTWLAEEEFMLRPCTAIKTSDAKSFILKLENDGRSYGVIHNVFNMINSSFREAVEDDVIAKNPFDFHLDKLISIRPTKRVALTEEELANVLRLFKSDRCYQRWYDEVFILLNTGLRIGEFCGLTDSDVDFKRRRIAVTKQLNKRSDGTFYIAPPKTDSGNRVIPMTDEVANAIRRIISKRTPDAAAYTVDGYSGFIFTTNRNTPKTPPAYQQMCNRIEQKYNQIFDHKIVFSPHVLRHTFCSIQAARGLNVKTLQYIMGHSKADVTLNVYTHLDYKQVEEHFFSDLLTAFTPNFTPNAH